MMETETAPLLFVEAATADGVWTVRSSDGVVGHIFRVDAKYAYFAGRFNGLTATFPGAEFRAPQGTDRRPQSVTPWAAVQMAAAQALQ